MRRKFVCGLAAAVAAFAVAACGGSSSPAGPTPPTGGGTQSTVTITASGVSPKSITVAPGAQVTFVNNDSRSHQIASNPHPEHTDCPPINDVGVLNPGQSRQTGNLNTTRVCGYHDHIDPLNAAWQGTINIQ